MKENFRPTKFRTQARAALAGKWNACAVMALLYLLAITIAVSLELWRLPVGTAGLTIMHPVATLLYFIVLIFGVTIVALGLMFVFLDVSRGADPKIETMAEPAKSYWRYIATNLVVSIYVTLWMMLLFIPGIIKAISYSQTFFIMRENPEMGINDAISQSMKMMKGHKMDYFLLNLSFLGWTILGFLALGVGLIWVIPYIQTAAGAFYDELKIEQGQVTA